MNTIDECISRRFFRAAALLSSAARPMNGRPVMTFCLGITVDEGLVAIADTRVVAGNECLVARKTATYQGPGFSFFVMTSGLRSLRDKILLYFEEAFARDTMARERLFKAVNLYAQPGAARGARRTARRSNRAELQLQRVLADRRADVGRFHAPAVPGVSGGQLGGDRTRHAVPDHRRVGVRQADPGALADAHRFHAVRVQGGPAGLRRDAPVRGRCRFPDGRDSVLPRQLRTWSSSATSGTTSRAISDWWQERMRRSVHDLPSEWIEAAFSRLTRDEVVL